MMSETVRGRTGTLEYRIVEEESFKKSDNEMHYLLLRILVYLVADEESLIKK